MSPKDFLMKTIEDIDEKTDRIDARLTNIEKVLIIQEENLKTHMYRTELAEKSIERLYNQLTPVTVHVTQMEAAIKILGVASVVAGVTVAVLRIFGWL